MNLVLMRRQTTDAITDIKVDQVHRIHINRPIRDDLVFVKQADKQWIMEQCSCRCQPMASRSELSPVWQNRNRYAVTPSNEMNLADLQLDPPYASAIVNDTAIEFGILEPIDDLRYVRVTDSVHLIPDSYLQLMETGFSQFVRPGLFGENERINTIQLPDLLVRKTDNALGDRTDHNL